MRWAILLTLWQFGCGPDDEVPPELPGDRPPPCELANPRHFLIDDVRVPEGTEVPIDIDEDGFIDTWNYPHRIIAPATEGRLASALSSAFSSHAILWILSTQECVDDDVKFARVAIRPGIAYESQPAPTVTIQTNGFSWAAGTRDGETIAASYGFGAIPAAATVDLEPSSVTDWQKALVISARVNIGATVEGTLVATFDPVAARDGFSQAIARTMTNMKALEPSCPQCSNEAFAVLIRAFDTNRDGLFDSEEIAESGYLESFGLQPMLDLFALYMNDEVYWPAHDRIADRLGASFAFSATEVQAN